MPARLNPYLSFPGNAREAMEFYRDVLGGTLTVSTFAEGGMAQDPADADKVMHAQLETDSGFTLMGSDTQSGAPSQPMSGVQVSLSGDANADAELSAYYDRLAAKGHGRRAAGGSSLGRQVRHGDRSLRRPVDGEHRRSRERILTSPAVG